ncbi:primosomal protein N' [Salinibacterium sp. SYSU T00001]|uniref:primosomal protein N' family DNA-binding protein n=1 Tax=Homoserinimonas sedimenticola TaxID=2986805 RepID=UPI002236B310|nr:primosomal protein N' [Salinibacterium sedimenticola]MCW4384354.1 primosomal protein N' [Salinibacterium sedimenticola]
MGEGSPRVARVMIESPLPQLDRLFDYSIPSSVAEECVPGVRVRVPLRSAGRVADGFVIELADEGEYEGALSPIEELVSPVPVLAPEVWSLARRVADRAAGTASDVVRLAVPRRQVRVEKAWLGSAAPERLPPVVSANVSAFGEGRLEAVVSRRERIALSAVPRLTRVTAEDVPPVWVGQWAVALASAASNALAGGTSAILAVPDYRDQEQLLSALRAVIPEEYILRFDARQSNPDRYRSHLAALGEEPRVIVGNRSAVYAPAARLGLIALWDDGDPLHAEPLAPYVHSRDAALIRQELQSSALILASHVRSAEVQRLVELGWLTAVDPERAVMPKVIPTAAQEGAEGYAAAARIPSTAWREATAALQEGPVLVQVARPGYAPGLACDSCGVAARCRSCSGPLAIRRAGAAPSCAWCGAIASGWRCSECDSNRMRSRGSGSQRTAEELGRAFPGVRVVVSDGERPVESVSAQPALVIATRGAEPIAEGGYRAVLLLDGERMLARESLRVAEDCLRWWGNAIALAAPGAPSILVGVGGDLARALATGRVTDFLHRELLERRSLRFPPAVRVATVVGTAETVEKAVAAVSSIAGVDVLGPTSTEEGVRAIVRFDYGAGGEVARALKSEIVRAATNRRRRVPPASGSSAMPRLRVRFDDPEPFV